MKKIFSSLVFLIVLFLPAAAFAENLTVAASANVQFALEEIKDHFEKNAGLPLETILGSSGKLSAQIENGAPFDLFLSADMEYPSALCQKGFCSKPPQIYAYGVLVLWTLNDMDLTPGFSVFLNPTIKKIAVADPASAPYGREAMKALHNAGVYESVQPKLIYGESIAQVNQFITTQAADVGLTAKSVVLAPNLKEKGRWVEVDPKFYQPIAQGAVILKYGEQHHPQAAQQFYDFLFSNEAREILKKYGYILP